jgi:hypothetical protein
MRTKSERLASLSVPLTTGAAVPHSLAAASGTAANELTSHLAGELRRFALGGLPERREVPVDRPARPDVATMTDGPMSVRTRRP